MQLINSFPEAMSKVLLLIFCATVASVKLPGTCPDVPPTHYDCKDELDEVEFMYSQIVFGIPFKSERVSILFQKIIAINGDLADLTIHINLID